MTKKILSLTVIAMLLVAIAIIPASAEEVQPRAEICPDCGSITSTYYSSWYTYKTESVACIHGTGAYDTVKYQRKYKTVDCGNNSCEYYERTVYDTRTVVTCGG